MTGTAGGDPDIGPALAPFAGGGIGLAVSGGSDSVALLHLAADWARMNGAPLAVVTVDHGLRAAAADEAAFVAAICARLGLSHDILRWDWDGRGNLQDRARRARRALIADWARARGIGAVALGHTADDQAETFVMRLARGAGVTGLAAMAARSDHAGITWLRPLLAHGRAELRDILTRRGQEWCDDPSNTDPRYERVRVRQAMAQLAPLGLEPARLAAVAGLMAGASEALAVKTADAARALARIDAGDVVFDRAGLLAEPAEIRHRLLTHALRWVASAEYPPRAGAMAGLDQALRAGRSFTLHGCLVTARGGDLRISREYQAVRHMTAGAGAIWDRRWRILSPDNIGLQVRALGDPGIAQLPGWRATGRPRAHLRALPALWSGNLVVASPLTGPANGVRAELIHGPDHFVASFISH